MNKSCDMTNNWANGDKRLSLFVCAYIASYTLNMCAKTLLPISGGMWRMVSLFFGAVIAIAFFNMLPTLLNRIGGRFLITEVLVVFLFFCSYLMGFSEKAVLTSTFFWTAVICVPIGSAGMAVKDKTVLFHMMRTLSFYLFPILCIALLSMRDRGLYSMPVSYALVLPVLFLLTSFDNNGRWISLALALAGTMLIALFGARGPLACIAFYIVLKIYMYRKNKKGISRIFLLLFAILAVLALSKVILSALQILLKSRKINSYVLRRIVGGSLLQSTGRMRLWEHYLEMIRQRPLSGYGVMGGWIDASSGPHNMLLELLLAFGVLLGGTLCCYVIYLFIKAISNNQGESRDLYLILASYNVTMYLVAGNCLKSPLFFLFVFLAVGLTRCSETVSKKYEPGGLTEGV